MQFRDGNASNPSETGRINQLERKLNIDVTRLSLSIFVAIEIHWPNAMVDDNRLEVSLLFAVGFSSHLPHVEQNWLRLRASGSTANEILLK